MPDCTCPLKQASVEAPQELAWIDPDISLTFAQLNEQTEKIVVQLDSLGIGEGSLVACRLPSSSQLISLFFAVWRLGASLCPLHLRFTEYQIKMYLEDLSPHLFITSFPFTHEKKRNKAPLSIAQSLFLFTSGSTGTPKIAVLSLFNLIINAKTSLAKLDLQTQDRWLLSLPLYHVGGIGIIMRSILAKSAIVLDEKNLDITHLSWVPTQLYRSTPIYKKLRCLLLGGAPVSLFPKQLPYFVTYGLTEMGSLTTLAYQSTTRSCGHLLEERELSISPNGEILVKGNCLFQGYWVRGTLENPFNQDGWFATGDLGSYSKSKGLIIQGRKDWQFISGGENIQPEEIEKALLEIETVLEAVVLPLDDPEFGQRPIAWIRSSNPHFNFQQMQTALSNQLPKYKIPISLFLTDEIPKLGMKPDRKKLFEKTKHLIDAR